jgi:hypothetical protein
MWSIYINPQTGTYEVIEGRPARCTRALGKALSATMTQIGTVPGLPEWGTDLTAITHLDTATPMRLQGEIDRVLRPLLGVDLVSYSRTAWIDETGPLYAEIKVSGLDGEISTDLIEVTG